MAELAVVGATESASNLGFHSGFKGSKGPVSQFCTAPGLFLTFVLYVILT